jgi:hypothetical protein
MDLYQIVTVNFVNRSKFLITTKLTFANDPLTFANDPLTFANDPLTFANNTKSDDNEIIIGKENNQFLPGEGLYGSFIVKFKSCQKFNFYFYSDIPNHEIKLLKYKSSENYMYNLVLDIIYEDCNNNKSEIIICNKNIEYLD